MVNNYDAKGHKENVHMYVLHYNEALYYTAYKRKG